VTTVAWLQLQEWRHTNVDGLPQQLQSDPESQKFQTLLHDSKHLCSRVLEIIHRDVTRRQQC
jgi:hypothetical protein